jgi:hypothetical protein
MRSDRLSRVHVHGRIVEPVTRNAGDELELAQVIHDDWAYDTGRRPGRQEPAVSGAHELSAADTLRHSTHQISQNCGVLCASLRCVQRRR